jgi:hypothetical protein
MKITAHTLISSVTGLSLVAYTLVSLINEGPATPGAVLGFSFLAVYGLLEMALIEYVPLGHSRTLRPCRGNAGGKGAGMVEFPAAVHARRAA